jgi:hypothetical protein
MTLAGGPKMHKETGFVPEATWLSARKMNEDIYRAVYPFGFAISGTCKRRISRKGRAVELYRELFLKISEPLTEYLPTREISTMQRSAYILGEGIQYTRLMVLNALALTHCWLDNDITISFDPSNKWYEGLQWGMFLDGETLYLLDSPIWSQNVDLRLQMSGLQCPISNPKVVLFAVHIQDELAHLTMVKKFPWVVTFEKSLRNGMRVYGPGFVNEPYFCRADFFKEGVMIREENAIKQQSKNAEISSSS